MSSFVLNPRFEMDFIQKKQTNYFCVYCDSEICFVKCSHNKINCAECHGQKDSEVELEEECENCPLCKCILGTNDKCNECREYDSPIYSYYSEDEKELDDSFLDKYDCDRVDEGFNSTTTWIEIQGMQVLGTSQSIPASDDNFSDVKTVSTEDEISKMNIKKYEDDGKSNQCAICQENYQNDEQILILKCHHYFHKSCIAEWIGKQSNKCPLCREKISKGKLINF